MRTLECKGSLIAYEKLGRGRPVLFAHCSSASHREWLFAARELSSSHACYLPDLMGYGETASQFDELGREVACRDTDILGALVDRAGEPVDIVAHSYGAAATLEFAAGRPEAVRSLFVLEPVSFQLLAAEGCESERQAIRRLARDIMSCQRRGKSRAAARHYMSFWIGPLRWALAPRSFKATVVRTMEKVAYEFSLIPGMSTDTARFRRLGSRTTIVSGDRSPRPALAVVDILTNALPQCRAEVIRGAGHMSPFTHREQVLALVRRHLASRPTST